MPGKSWQILNPFEQKNFIENKGQVKPLPEFPDFKIDFTAYNNGIEYYLSGQGIIFCKIIEVKNEEERKENNNDAEKELKYYKKHIYEILEFKNTKATDINVGLKQNNYYTFLDSRIKNETATIIASAYKTITYSNIYPGIDLIFSFPDDSAGIKYSFALKQGSDHNNIVLKFDKNFDIHTTPLTISATSENFDLSLHLLQNKQLKNEEELITRLKNKEVQITNAHFKTNFTSSITYWINNLVNLTGNNGAFDIDYDKNGNVYIYGGSIKYTLNKYDPNGNLLWTNTPFNNDQYMYGDFAIDRRTGNAYVVEGIGLQSGAHIAKLNPSGTGLAFFNGHNSMGEIWRIAFDPCTYQGVIVGGGNGGGPTYQSCLLDTSLLIFNPINFLDSINKSFSGDMSCLAMDHFGHCYQVSNSGSWRPTNQLYRFNMSNLNNPTHISSTGFTLIEYSSTYFHKPESYLGNGLNGLIASNKHLYAYDGYTLKKYDNANLNLLTSKVIEPGDNSKIYWSGIAANNCDIILVSDKNKILQLDSNLNTIQTFNMPDNVYDILYNDHKMYVSGKQFVLVVNINNMDCIHSSLVVSQPDSCRGKGTATIDVSGGTTPYSIQWSTMPVQTGTAAVGLSPGNTYTVIINDSYPCPNNKSEEVFKLPFPQTFSLNTEITPATCLGINDGRIEITPSNGASPYYFDWTNGPKGNNVYSVSNLASGFYTVTISDARGCEIVSNPEIILLPNFNFGNYSKVNVFTPNNDGTNDVFFPLLSNNRSSDEISREINSYQLNIYDRWGTLIFESSKFKNRWDATTTSGLACSEGTYFWTLKLLSNCSETKPEGLNGFIQLIR